MICAVGVCRKNKKRSVNLLTFISLSLQLSDSPPPHGPVNMSTDDSISEDVSSSAALSHCHVSADGDVGKESETSLVSSEGTSASGHAVSEDRRATSQTTGGTVESRPVDITPACNKIRCGRES